MAAERKPCNGRLRAPEETRKDAQTSSLRTDTSWGRDNQQLHLPVAHTKTKKTLQVPLKAPEKNLG